MTDRRDAKKNHQRSGSSATLLRASGATTHGVFFSLDSALSECEGLEHVELSLAWFMAVSGGILAEGDGNNG